MRSESPRADLLPALVVSAASANVVFLLAFLVRRSEPDVASTPLVESGARLYYLVALACAVGIGVISVARGNASPPGPAGRAWLMGVVPGFGALAAALLLVWYRDVRAMIVIPLLFCALLFLWLSLPYILAGRTRQWARAAIAIVTLYAVLAMIMSFRMQTLRGMPVYDGLAAGAAVSLILVSGERAGFERRFGLRAGAVGLVAAELVWAFGYVQASHWLAAIPVTAAALIGGWLIRDQPPPEWLLRWVWRVSALWRRRVGGQSNEP